MRFVVLGLAIAPLALLLQAGAAEPPVPNTTNGFAPLEYFQNSCARCHGDYGSAYGDTFGAKLSNSELHRVVREMAEGPAQAPLEGAELQTETDFHIALRDKKPFVVVTKIEGYEIFGEGTPGSTVTLVQGDESRPIALEGHAWEGRLGNLNPATARIRVEKSGQVAEWPLVKPAQP